MVLTILRYTGALSSTTSSAENFVKPSATLEAVRGTQTFIHVSLLYQATGSSTVDLRESSRAFP